VQPPVLAHTEDEATSKHGAEGARVTWAASDDAADGPPATADTSA